MRRSTTPRKEAISTSTLPEEAGVLVAKRHHLLVRWSHWLNVPILLGLILSGISIYWSSPIYQHKPDPVTGNFDVAARVFSDDEVLGLAGALFDGLYEYRRRALLLGRDPA